MPILRLVLKNATRNKLRTILTICGIAVGVIAYGFLQTVLAAYFMGVEASSPNRLVTRHRVSLFYLLPLSQQAKIAQIEGVTQVAKGIWFGGYYQTPEKFFAQFAIDPEYVQLYPEFIVPEEQWNDYKGDLQAAIIGRKLADRFGWKVGDRVSLIGGIYPGEWDFTIRGIYTGQNRNTDETAMFFHWKRLDEATGNASRVGWYLVGVEDPSMNARISDEIDALFFNSSAPTLTETEEEFNLSFVAMMGSIITIIQSASWIVIGIVLLIMANTMAMAARERITEYGVMKTLGFRGIHLAWLIGGEALLVSLVGAALGCVASLGLVGVVGRRIEVEMGSMFPVFELTGQTAAQATGLAIAAGLLASTVPAARAVKVPIIDALRRLG